MTLSAMAMNSLVQTLATCVSRLAVAFVGPAWLFACINMRVASCSELEVDKRGGLRCGQEKNAQHPGEQ
ncbi:MAG TPA: hypothetical protein VG713_19475, partial [Pirellulales bacterium]|nr:hypothetical protein [Pirellulales bacterium]